MDVVNVEQARIAEEAGAVAVMALERVPADIRKDGGVARMSDPTMIKQIKEAVTIPVMAKARIGHFVEGQVLESIGIDYIDESEVLTPADEINHLNKHKFKVPVLCGCRDLGEALRRIAEGSSMIRTKGEAGTGNVVEAVRHCRAVMGDIRRLCAMDEDEVFVYAKEIRAPLELVQQTRKLGRLPVVNFAAGGVATPADAALMMQLGMDGVFVGSGIFKSGDPAKRARAIVQAVTHYNDPKIIAEVSCGLGEPWLVSTAATNTSCLTPRVANRYTPYSFIIFSRFSVSNNALYFARITTRHVGVRSNSFLFVRMVLRSKRSFELVHVSYEYVSTRHALPLSSNHYLRRIDSLIETFLK